MMYQSGNHRPQQMDEGSMMTTPAANHYGVPPMKQPDDPSSRTTSPTVLLHSGYKDSAGSPLGASQSTLSTSSPLSSDHYHYSHSGIHPYHPCIVTRSPKVPISTAAPLPVRSASWAAGTLEARSPTSSVPTIITTQDGPSESTSAPSLLNFKLQQKSPSNNGKPIFAVKKKQNAKGDKISGARGKEGGVVNARRQKRLERNRESARLSRRRRKQYLEVLEDRVSHLSLEMDQGRRAHAAAAIATVVAKRSELLDESRHINPNHALPALDTPLSRTSKELSVLNTFQMQQLKSFSLPAHSKFVLWLTLQGDTYFRGGRAASERLSAARIGERMLNSGHDLATPINPMWPLFCNEVSLSYDQEERVRMYQRTLLQDSPTWLERHTARASSLVMQSFHDSTNAVATHLHQREITSTASFSPEQRMKLLCWAEKNAERIRLKFHARRKALGKEKESEKFKILPSQHTAANLYIMNHRLQKVLTQFPPQVELVNAAHMKRLSRRPSFEALGQQKDDNSDPMCRENSFASSGSLKRSVSSLSMVSENGEEKPPQQVSPEDGEGTAAPLIERELGFIKKLIPPIVQPVLPPAPAPVSLPPAPEAYIQHHYEYAADSAQHSRLQPAAHSNTYTLAPPHHYHQPQGSIQHFQHGETMPPPSAPAPSSHHTYHQQYYEDHSPSQIAYPQNAYAQPAPEMVFSEPAAAATTVAGMPHHARKNSFLPPHLNVVPEEMFPTTDGSEDFLMSLIDDNDWAIGEGVDMDTAV